MGRGLGEGAGPEVMVHLSGQVDVDLPWFRLVFPAVHHLGGGYLGPQGVLHQRWRRLAGAWPRSGSLEKSQEVRG